MLGAGLFAANLSTTFRLRKFGMADKVPYSVSFEMTAPNPGPEKLLVPAMKKMPTKRVFSFANVTDDGFAFKLHYDNKPGEERGAGGRGQRCSAPREGRRRCCRCRCRCSGLLLQVESRPLLLLLIGRRLLPPLPPRARRDSALLPGPQRAGRV